MGIRLQGEFRTLKDDQYQVQIIDNAYNGAVNTINLGGDGFTLTHDGEVDTVYSPIIGSSVSVGIYNDSSAVDSFRTALLNAQDKQFSIRILRYKKPADKDIINDYRNRVVADGGEYTGGRCLTDALDALGVGSESRSNIITTYLKDRVEADGGTFEAENCVVDAIDALGGTTDIPAELYELYWTGFIAQDLIEEIDESKPRLMQITAADGMSLLSTVDYNFGLASSTAKTFKDAILEMLEDAGIAALFDSDEPILTTVVNWYAEEMTYSATMDPLDNMKTDLKVYTSWTQGQGRSYTPSLNIIRDICTILGARFYFSNGTYRFEQIGQRDIINVREFKYLKNGTEDSLTTVQRDILVDQDTVYRSQGVFRFLPAAKKVELIQERKSEADLLRGVVTYDAQFGDEIDVGIIPSANNGRITMDMRSKFQTYIATPTAGTATPVFAVTIRLEPSDGSANQYWQNNLVSGATSFGAPFWGTTVNTYKWAATTVSRQSNTTTKTFHAMATGPLPKDGEIYIDITILGFYDAQGSSTSFFIGGNSYAWAVDLEKARFENDNTRGTVQSTFIANNTNPNIGSNITVTLGPTSIGDGPGAAGSLLVYNGSTYEPSTGWRVGENGSYIDVSKLVTKEILSLQNTVVNRFEGVAINGGDFIDRLRFDGAYWLPLRSELNANRDELNVEAFKIAKISAFADISGTPVDMGDPTVGSDITDFNGTYTNVSTGIVGGMAVDGVQKTIGPFSETANGGAVEGDLNVTSDVNIQKDLNVDGAALSSSLQLAGGSGTQGLMEWNGDEDTIELQMNGASHMLGQDMVYNVKNQTGSTIDKGVAVMAVGTLGSSGRILISRMDASGDVPARFFLGVTAEAIADGADGKVIEFGKIRNIDTSSFAAGDVLWLSPTTDGAFTATEPVAPNLKIATAFVINSHASTGVIMVRANQGHKLQDAHDVRIGTLVDGDILRWDEGLQVWYNTPFPG